MKACIAALLVFSLGLTSPSLVLGRPRLGVKAGASFASVSTQYLDTKGLTGLAIGLGAVASTCILLPNSVRLDMLYVQKSWKTETARRGPSNEDLGTIRDKFNTGELDVIVLAEQRFDIGPITPFVATGPELGFVVDTRHSGGIPPSSGDVPWWSETNFSWNVGAGVALPAGPGEVGFEVRGSFGLKDMNDGYGMAVETFHTRSIQILAGFAF